MTSRLPFPTLFLLFFFLLSVELLVAQQNPTVHLVGSAMRAPLDVPAGQNIVHLCDLTPGNTYSVFANGMAAGQAAAFEIQPAGGMSKLSDQLGKKNTFRFTATAACVDIQLQATALQPVSSIPMYLSVRCEDCPKSKTWREKLLQETGASVLEVMNNANAADLITNTLIGGSCYNVSNVTYSGQPGQIGTFSNGATNIGFANGMLLATGNISVAPGPNDDDNASAGYGNGTPDADLATLTGGSIVDRADIEFDFTPTVSQVSFEYAFASEEYCEYVNSQFNDAFGFFISGPGIVGTKNLAVIGANTPVSINTINHLTNSGLYVHNTPFFGNSCGIPPAFGPAINELQYDGFTKKLTAVVNVVPCQTYHIKLKIADVSDGIFDSAVFLRANSFAAGNAVTVETVYPAGQSFAYEGCKPDSIRFVRGNGNVSQSLVVSYSVGATSTATPGADYTPLGPIVIPAGQTELVIPVNVLNDQILEGEESIVLLVNNSCSCDQSQVTFLIRDRLDLFVELANQTICNGSTTTLSPIVTGGVAPFIYQWSTADTSASIVVSPSLSTSYIVTVTDACGATAVDTAEVMVLPAIQNMQTLAFCPGDSVTLNGVTYYSSDTIVQVTPGENGACDTVLTYVLQLLPQPVTKDTISFCSGTSVTIGGVVYTAPGIVQDTLPGTNGACDTIATYVLQVVSQAVINDTISFCAGTTVTIGGVVYSGPGTVVDTLLGANGTCDTLATYVLQLLPQFVIQDTISFCTGDTINIGGVNYTGAGIVQDTLSGANGACDTLATYVLELLPQPTLYDTISLCPGDSVVIGGSVYTQAGTVLQTIRAVSGGCDTLATYTIVVGTSPLLGKKIQLCEGDSIKINGISYSQTDTVFLTIPALTGCDTLATYFLEFVPHPTLKQTVTFCPGDSVTIGGVSYGQPDTITLRLPALFGCDTVATYLLQFAPQPTVTRTFEFCSGDSIKINGVFYSQPDTLVFNIPATVGCDTVATYILKYLRPTGPTAVNIKCPDNITLTIDSGAGSTPVTYATPTATTDCPCPGIDLHLQQGLASGSNFPVGLTKVCYTAKDSCSNSATCCFNVTVSETTACDIKVIGCIKYELLSVTEDLKKRKTYRIRTTNNCTERMTYMLTQLPTGVIAALPADNSTYTAPSGRPYKVRNPNFSPFYSVRYHSTIDSIHNGESDIFKYTLPPQSAPDYIHVQVRLESGGYYEAYLNTFFCPVGFDPNPGGSGAAGPADRHADLNTETTGFSLFPNPTNGTLFADLSAWNGQSVQLRIFSVQGRLLQSVKVQAGTEAQALELPSELANGLYLLEVTPAQGQRQTQRFSVLR